MYIFMIVMLIVVGATSLLSGGFYTVNSVRSWEKTKNMGKSQYYSEVYKQDYNSVMSGVKIEDYNRQIPVHDNLKIYGIHNQGGNMDDRVIYVPPYDSLGL